MTEEEKMLVATFRFGVICDLVNVNQINAGEQERLIRDKCARKWQIPFSTKSRISRSTILRWLRLYKQSAGQLKALYPAGRCDRGKSRSLDEDTCLALNRLRKELPRATVKKLIEQMLVRGLVDSASKLPLTTVYRFLHQQGLMYPQGPKPIDRRKFEAELPNDLWQSDVMHGPKVQVDLRQRKSYLIAIIDDNSRLVPHGEFYVSEKLDNYLDALQKALLKRGLPRKLYVDNGPAFRSRHLEHVCASLAIGLVHSKPYQPQGRGKIERFFRTVRSDFLPGFKGQTLDELNEAFDLWLAQIYHQRKHGSTAQSPFDRFTAQLHCLRPAPADLTDYFRQTVKRRVGKDRSVVLNGKLYEAPVALIGQKVQLLFHGSDPQRVEVCYQQKSYGLLSMIDVHVNCRVRRDKNCNPQLDVDPVPYQGGKLL
jgi:putative transposase